MGTFMCDASAAIQQIAPRKEGSRAFLRFLKTGNEYFIYGLQLNLFYPSDYHIISRNAISGLAQAVVYFASMILASLRPLGHGSIMVEESSPRFCITPLFQ